MKATLEAVTGKRTGASHIRHVVDFQERFILEQPANVKLMPYKPELDFVVRDPCLTHPSMLDGAWSFAEDQSGAGLRCCYCHGILCFGKAAFYPCPCGFGGELERAVTGEPHTLSLTLSPTPDLLTLSSAPYRSH